MKVAIVAKKNYKEINIIKNEFEISKNPDIVFAIGGDGTFLRAANEFDVPILPIRSDERGSTGYYSDVPLKELETIIELLKHRRFYVENLSRKVLINFRSKDYYAVNEALIRSNLSDVYFRVWNIRNNDKELLLPFIVSGDGAIFATRIGSTAYNLSAGGPVLLNDSAVLTFLLPDSTFHNPIVFDSSYSLGLEVVKGKGVLGYDGIKISNISKGDFIRFSLSDKYVRVIKLRGIVESQKDKFYRLIMSKLNQFID